MIQDITQGEVEIAGLVAGGPEEAVEADAPI